MAIERMGIAPTERPEGLRTDNTMSCPDVFRADAATVEGLPGKRRPGEDAVVVIGTVASASVLEQMPTDAKIADYEATVVLPKGVVDAAIVDLLEGAPVVTFGELSDRLAEDMAAPAVEAAA